MWSFVFIISRERRRGRWRRSEPVNDSWFRRWWDHPHSLTCLCASALLLFQKSRFEVTSERKADERKRSKGELVEGKQPWEPPSCWRAWRNRRCNSGDQHLLAFFCSFPSLSSYPAADLSWEEAPPLSAAILSDGAVFSSQKRAEAAPFFVEGLDRFSLESTTFEQERKTNSWFPIKKG